MRPATNKPMTSSEDGKVSMKLAPLIAILLVLGACAPHVVPSFGYKPEAVPGITRARCIEILGKPQDSQPFSMPGTNLAAEAMTYQFGQVLVEDGIVVAVSVNNDPAFVGPFGIKIGMSEDDLRSALAHHAHHAGHIELYDAIGRQSDTRTKDIYDDTDHLMIELTAANANDPLAPFNVAQVTLANHAGMILIDAFTKARIAGLYPDVHVDNFVSNTWQIGR